MKSPYKLTPIHEWHKRHGGALSLVNGWIRVSSYGDLTSELDTARRQVGLCDVTPIAKADVQGHHSGAVLARAWGFDMAGPGKCMSVQGEKGGFTDSYAIQVTSERFLVLAAPEQRDQLCKALASDVCGYDCVHVTDVTSSYAAIRIVGPMSPQLLKKLGPAYVDSIALNRCVQTVIARVPTVLVRRDFGRNPGWLLLMARAYAEYVWECIFDAGQEFGIKPFGISAEQILMREEASSVAIV